MGAIAIDSGASVAPLPDDFGGFEGQLNGSLPASSVVWPIDLVSEGRIRQMYALTPTTSGRPLFAGLQPLKGVSATRGQRQQLILYPLADQAYVLQCTYYVNPDYLTTAFPFHLGGAQHAETILESCLAVAEERLDDAQGVHAAAFKTRLMASIGKDRQNKPQSLGYNADRSDSRFRQTRASLHWLAAVKVNGVQY